MNGNVCKPLSSTAGIFVSNKIYKNSNRRNRKNNVNYSNSKSRQGCRKNFSSLKLTNSRNLHSFKKPQYKTDTRSSSTEIMSNWYWSNYKKALEWQDKHKIAHWKAHALALQEENKYLIEVIRSMSPRIRSNVFFTKKPHFGSYPKEYSESDTGELKDSEEDTCDNSEPEFEVSEEMIQFFKQSYKHKLEVQKEKAEKQDVKAEKEVNQIQTNRLKRWEEMNLLYGDKSSMIIGMETAIQLSFNKYCDTKSPKYWPNIPLKL